MDMGGHHEASVALASGIDSVPVLEQAGWDPGPIWTCEKNLAPPSSGFEPRTAQTVAIRYTDWTILTQISK